RSAAALSRLGISGDPAGLPIGDGVHDVLSRDRASGAVPHWRADDGGGPRPLLPLPPPDRSGSGYPHVSSQQMLQRRLLMAAAAGLLLLAAAPVRAADVSPNDVARFIAGLPPAADSPLAPLTREKAWQDHAKTFDASFERAEANISRVRAW